MGTREPARRRPQPPENRGARFSANAAIPSAKSPEAAVSRWVRASNSSWSSICSYSHRFNCRFVPAYEFVGPDASWSSSAAVLEANSCRARPD